MDPRTLGRYLLGQVDEGAEQDGGCGYRVPEAISGRALAQVLRAAGAPMRTGTLPVGLLRRPVRGFPLGRGRYLRRGGAAVVEIYSEDSYRRGVRRERADYVYGPDFLRTARTCLTHQHT
jgi:hypothetical protein